MQDEKMPLKYRRVLNYQKSTKKLQEPENNSKKESAKIITKKSLKRKAFLNKKKTKRTLEIDKDKKLPSDKVQNIKFNDHVKEPPSLTFTPKQKFKNKSASQQMYLLKERERIIKAYRDSKR